MLEKEIDFYKLIKEEEDLECIYEIFFECHDVKYCKTKNNLYLIIHERAFGPFNSETDCIIFLCDYIMELEKNSTKNYRRLSTAIDNWSEI